MVKFMNDFMSSFLFLIVIISIPAFGLYACIKSMFFIEYLLTAILNFNRPESLALSTIITVLLLFSFTWAVSRVRLRS